MIASLFWALAHAWPEGDGVTSSLASKGWMLYLQVMMTPILMLAGFFIGMLIVYTGLMLAIVWKSFDMTAELKNWVFEWIGGSPRAMGENQSQQQHIMGVVGGAKSSMSQATSSGANAAGLAKNRKQKQGGGEEEKSTAETLGAELDKRGLGAKQETNSEPKEDTKKLE